MRGKVFTLASVALLSCRAVLGIEELDDQATDAGTGANDGGASDSARTDADTGANPNACVSSSDCGRCCRMAAGAAYKEELEPIIKPCLCDGGCSAQCTTNICAGGDPAGTACLPCMDDAIQADTCKKERDQCFQSGTCKAVYDCIKTCP